MSNHPSPSIPAPPLPAAFCWTKMGTEAGEGLAAIVRRKNWERRANAGVFFWGIGNSLGSAVHALVARTTAPQILFSPIRSKPRAVDVAPKAVRLWLTYLDDEGRERPLPTSSWVTSRAPDEDRETPHYALVCKSERELRVETEGPSIAFEELRNLTTGRKLGFSQVTSVVERSENADAEEGLRYAVALRATLAAPYYVRLCKSITLEPTVTAAQAAKVAQVDADGWLGWVRHTKQAAWKALSATSVLEHQLPMSFTSSE